MQSVEIYTDGACLGNPGPGGYGVILIYGDHRQELSGGFRLTTNNRMEILAAIMGLQSLKKTCEVTLYSDSKYVVDSMTQGWAKRWQANNWLRNRREKALNPDLWSELLRLSDQHTTSFRWVRGHSGHPENERCDQLAVAAARQNGLPRDLGYES
ncbi:MAG: hypothetical protein OHK0012_04080 [Synechococcales cyanobacterium]